jgi:YbgC/YbaW family acyl-CoA thioester hydrolase
MPDRSRSLPPPVYSVDLTVGEDDLDDLGHVNNARYMVFLERSRTGWYEAAGLFAACQAAHERAGNASKVDTVVVNIDLDFLNECRLGEPLRVNTAPIRLGRKSFAVRQTIEKPGGDLAADAVVTSVVMDLETRRTIVLPTELVPLFPPTEDRT